MYIAVQFLLFCIQYILRKFHKYLHNKSQHKHNKTIILIFKCKKKLLQIPNWQSLPLSLYHLSQILMLHNSIYIQKPQIVNLKKQFCIIVRDTNILGFFHVNSKLYRDHFFVNCKYRINYLFYKHSHIDITKQFQQY